MKNPSKKHRRSPAETRAWWQRHVEAHQVSGVSQAEYCRTHSLDKGSLSQWLRTDATSLEISALELSLLLDGIDFTRLKKLLRIPANTGRVWCWSDHLLL